MSNLNKPFNENGPIVIPEKDFKIYQSERKHYQNIHQAIIDWIIRPINNDNVRRLCLRDLLRQNYNHSCGYHNMDGCYVALLRLDDLGGIYQALCDSEKHRNEFIEEAMYNIEHHLVPDSSSRDTTELLELLIVLQNDFKISKINAEQLWQLHSINRPKDPLTRAWDDFKFCQRGMCLWIDDAHTPSHFYAEIQKRCIAAIIDYINDCQDIMRQRGNVFSIQKPFDPNLIGYLDPPSTPEEFLIRLCQTIARLNTSKSNEYYIDVFENHLDANIRYLPTERIPKILMDLNNTDLSCRCLERHIALIPDKEIIKYWSSDKFFLYWARGVITLHRPDRQDCIAKIDACLLSKTK